MNHCSSKPSQNESDLHGEPHECSVVRYLLNVVHGKADQEVHDNDRHGEYEEDKKEQGECWVGHMDAPLDAAVRHVVPEHVREVDFAEHHDEGFDAREARVGESWLSEREGCFIIVH